MSVRCARCQKQLKMPAYIAECATTLCRPCQGMQEKPGQTCYRPRTARRQDNDDLFENLGENA